MSLAERLAIREFETLAEAIDFLDEGKPPLENAADR